MHDSTLNISRVRRHDGSFLSGFRLVCRPCISRPLSCSAGDFLCATCGVRAPATVCDSPYTVGGVLVWFVYGPPPYAPSAVPCSTGALAFVFRRGRGAEGEVLIVNDCCLFVTVVHCKPTCLVTYGFNPLRRVSIPG